MSSEARPSMHDVARAANCSVAAVSYAFNGNGRISAARRAEIRAVCARMGYIPSAAGRSLRAGRTSAVGLLFYPSCAQIFGNAFYAEVMGAFEEVLVNEGFNLLMAGYDFSKEGESMPKFVGERAVDACVLVGAHPREFVPRLRDCGIPLLLLDGDGDEHGVDSISSAGFEAGRILAHHFARLGHKRIGVLRYAPEDRNSEDRLAGFRAGLSERGLRLPESRILMNFNYHEHEKAGAAALQLAGPPHRCTAIFAINDVLAYQAWMSFEQAGIAVPSQISLAGFDDLHIPGIASRPLTTFRVDRKEIGREGAKLILRRLKNPSEPANRVMVGTQLIDRGSLGSPLSRP